ncbi:MAG: CAP domain-containing protein [Campylobacteraceae bacterium]|jgi:uncharacterized protein YkwD|nr:CAP domain-containing protein [Campylobacteraceae bacterium]
MKYLAYTLIFFILLIAGGIIFSQKGESKPISPQKTALQSDTLLVGKISFNAQYENETYEDSEGIRLKIRSGGVIYESVSDKNGIFFLQNIPDGVYEITELHYEKNSVRFELFYTFRLSLFFELKKGAVNNIGTLLWRWDKEQSIESKSEYHTVKFNFERRYDASTLEWTDVAVSYHAPILKERAASVDGWDRALDTAWDANYMSAIEKDVIFEMNKARSDPKKYAQLYIKPRLERFKSLAYEEDGELPTQTKEGIKAVQECYDAMMRASAVPLLYPSRALFKAAKEHTSDQEKSGRLGHEGSDKSSPIDRMSKYLSGFSIAAENIAYGPNSAKAIVAGLLIDDGVPTRGHRETILNTDYNLVGVSVGRHPQYGTMCVSDFVKK